MSDSPRPNDVASPRLLFEKMTGQFHPTFRCASRLLTAAALVAGCTNAGATASSTTSPNCVTMDGRTVDAITWSIDGSVLAATSSNLSNGLETLNLVSWPSLRVTTPVGESDTLQPGAALDDQNEPIWITVRGNGESVIVQRGTSSAGATDIGSLPHPRFFWPEWTRRGLLLLEWSGDGVEPNIPQDTYRPVVVAVPSSAEEARRLTVDPLTTYIRDVSWARSTTDGTSLALTMSGESGVSVLVTRGNVRKTIDLPSGAANAEFYRDETHISYLDHGTGQVMSRGVDDGRQVALVGDGFALSTTALNGSVAAVTNSASGGASKICFAKPS